MLLKNFYTPNDVEAMSDTDSKSIQNAIDLAVKSGCFCVHIPRANHRNNSYTWIIDETIRLPDNITVVLEGAHMIMADDTYCNMFANKNAYTEVGRILSGEQKNIRICGCCGATIDGGKYNGRSEWNTKDGSLIKNCPILFANVDGFCVEGIHIKNQRYWGMVYFFCRNGIIRDMEIHADLASADENGNRVDKLPEDYAEVYIKNGDGIDIRVGCNNILIENIYGFTQDDTIALTALKGKTSDKFAVEGKDFDIHHITIKNIRSTVWYNAAQLRLLNEDGCRIYNITADTIIDTAPKELTYRNGSAILIGDFQNDYVKDVPQQQGDFHDVTISSVFSRGVAAVRLYQNIDNLLLTGIHTADRTRYALLCDHKCDQMSVFSNITVRDIFVSQESDIDSIISLMGNVEGKITIDGVAAKRVNNILINGSAVEVDLKNVNVEECTGINSTRDYSVWV